MLAEAHQNMMNEEEDELDSSLLAAFKDVKGKKGVLKIQHKLKRSQRAYPRNTDLNDVKEKLNERGIETTKLEERVGQKRRGTSLRRLQKETEMEIENNADIMEDEDEKMEKDIQNKLGNRKRSISRSKSKGFKIEKTEMAKVIFNLIYFIIYIFI